MTVLIQAGHQNIQSNCDVSLRPGTGAPGEVEWTPGITAGIVNGLRTAGVDARAVDANFNCDPAHTADYAAVVAVHYQANLPTASGFFVGAGDPSEDGAAAQSAGLAAAIRASYATETGLAFAPSWNNLNITHYYLFEALSKATPFALIECGVGAPGAPDHDFLSGTDGQLKVIDGITVGILAYLGIHPVPSPPPPPPPLTLEQRVSRIEHILAELAADLQH